MTNRQKILDFIEEHSHSAEVVCDDCISKETCVKPRQTVNKIARSLEKQNMNERTNTVCSLCDQRKLCNKLVGTSDLSKESRDLEEPIEEEPVEESKLSGIDIKTLLDNVLTQCVKSHIENLSEGFQQVGEFYLDHGEIDFELEKMEKETGIYVFVVNDSVKYVGETKVKGGLKKRIYHYKNLGPSQKTNIRLNKKIKEGLEKGQNFEIWFYNLDHLEKELISELTPDWNQSLQR